MITGYEVVHFNVLANDGEFGVGDYEAPEGKRILSVSPGDHSPGTNYDVVPRIFIQNDGRSVHISTSAPISEPNVGYVYFSFRIVVAEAVTTLDPGPFELPSSLTGRLSMPISFELD